MNKNPQGEARVAERDPLEVKRTLADMLKGGVIIEVATPEQAILAQEAGAAAVMAFTEYQPCNISAEGKTRRRMASADLIQAIQEAVTIPIMAQCRIGHVIEAQLLEALFIDFIEESPLLEPVDADHPINKHRFRIPFMSGCRDLREAMQHIGEGASLLCAAAECCCEGITGTVKALRTLRRQVRQLQGMDSQEQLGAARRYGSGLPLFEQVIAKGCLPVPLFAGRGVESPADAAFMIHLGADGIFVDNALFLKEDPLKSAQAIVQAVNFAGEPEMLAKISGELIHAEACLEASGDDVFRRAW